MKTLYIHIGTPKTGTTAIQTFCVENAGVLEHMGYAYPPSPYTYPNVSVRRNNGRFLVGVIKDEHGIRQEDEEKRIFKDGMAVVQKLFQKFDFVVLSDEAIWRIMDLHRKTLWEELKQEADIGNFQIKVIVYLRRQDQLIASLWNQKIKKVTGSLGEEKFEEFLNRIDRNLRLDYYAKLEKIAKVIGKENIVVRRFDRKSFHGGSIYSDFLETIGISGMDEFVISEGENNPGLYGNTHEIKRILNGLPEMGNMDNQMFFQQVMRRCTEISGKKYPCGMFSKEEALEFLADYEEGNKKIAQEYLKDEATDLFDLGMKDEPKWQQENPYMIEDIIRFVGESNVCLLEECRRLEAKCQKLLEEQEKLQYKVKHPVRAGFGSVVRRIRKNESDQGKRDLQIGK